MSGKLFGYARVSVASDADANNLENQRRVLVDCEQVFEDVGSGASWNRPGLNRLKATLQPGDCVKVAALDRLSRSLTEVMELLGWLREKGVEIISLRESIDQDSAMGRAMLHLAIVFAEMERDLARERTLAGLERVKATGKHLGRRKGVSRKRAEEITEHAPARRTLMGPHRHDNRVALQQHPPDLHLGPRRDSADRLRRRIAGSSGSGRWRHEGRHWLRNQTVRKSMLICLACEPDHELGNGYTPEFCGDHSREPASSEPRRPHLAVEFVREHMRRRRPGKAGVQAGLYAF